MRLGIAGSVDGRAGDKKRRIKKPIPRGISFVEKQPSFKKGEKKEEEEDSSRLNITWVRRNPSSFYSFRVFLHDAKKT